MIKMKKFMMHLLPLFTIILLIIFKFTASHPLVNEELSHNSSNLQNFSAVKSHLVTSNVEIINNNNALNRMIKKKPSISDKNLPSSPAGLLRPDTFQFYTFNQNGDVIMKQMSKQEIQSLIASGGGHFPMEIHEPQKMEEIDSDGTKIADVIQNVQNVLKGELNKPPSVISSIPKVPEQQSSQWSEILSSVLNTEMESDRINDTISHTERPQIITQNPIIISNSEIKYEIDDDTKPMIPITLINVQDQLHNHNDTDDNTEMPMYHVFNEFISDKNNNIEHRTNQSENHLQIDQVTSDVTKQSNVDSITSSSVTLCPSTSPLNCKHNNTEEIMKKPNDGLQQNDDKLMEKNKNNINHTSIVAHATTLETFVNDTDKNNKEEQPKPTTVLYNTELPVELDSDNKKDKESAEIHEPMIIINKTNTTDRITISNDNTTKHQNQTQTQTIETSTITSDILKIPQETSHNKDDMLIVKSNSSTTQQTLINNNINLFDNQTNITIDLSNISHTHTPDILSTDTISLISFEVTSPRSPITTTPSQSLTTNIMTNTSKVNNNTLSPTTTLLSHTTEQSLQLDQFTTHTQIELTNKTINNSKFNTTYNESIPHEKFISSTPTTTIILENSLSNSTSQTTESISTELVNSLTSMISQVSQMLPSIIQASNNSYQFNNITNDINIPNQISEQSTTSEKDKIVDDKIIYNITNINENVDEPVLELITITNDTKQNLPQNIKSNNERIEEKTEIINPLPETSIVHIDIMETKSDVNEKKNTTLKNKDDIDNKNINKINDDNNTESHMVRIQLTDPISLVHQTLELSPVQNTIKNIETITLPTNTNITANGIASGLIAGFNVNTNTSIIKEFQSTNVTEFTNKTALNEKTHVNDITVTEKIITTMNSTTISPTTITQHTEPEEVSKMTLANITTENSLLVTQLPHTTQAIKMINTTKCNYNNSLSNEIRDTHVFLCLTNKTSLVENSKNVTRPNEMKNTQSVQLTTISSHSPTELFINTEQVNDDITTQSVITEVPETRVDDMTEIIVSQVGNKTQIDEQISTSNIESITTVGTFEMQHVTDKAVELSLNTPTSSSTNLEFSSELSAKSNTTVKDSSPYPQDKLSTIPKSSDTMANSSDTTLVKIKDKKKDDLKVESLNKIGESSTVSSKTDDSLQVTEKLETVNKINTTDEVKSPEKWTLIPQKHNLNSQNVSVHTTNPVEHQISAIKTQFDKYPPTNALSEPKVVPGLDASIEKLNIDVSYFSILCNDLAFTFWRAVNSGLSTSRSVALSPFGVTSILAMISLGARGTTSDCINKVLKLDDVTSFNPHLVFHNITDSVGIAQHQGIANVAFVRELFADQNRVYNLMRFYKKQADQFYDGTVDQINFSTISDVVRRKTNFLIRKQTGGRIRNFVKTNTIPLRSPLAAVSANVFQTNCTSNDATSKGRDGELYFAVSPAVRQRKLVLVPATLWKAGVLAGYEPSLDATAFALGNRDNIVSTIFVIPGQPGFTASDDNLDLLEQRIITGALHDGAWNKLLKVIVPRPGLELQIPKFSHKSVINATAALKMMGLEELFLKNADFKGINGVGNSFHLADVVQMNLFSTCGDENIQSGKTKHHVEIYPASPQKNARDLKNNGEANMDNRGIHKNIYNLLKSVESNSNSSRQAKSEEKRVKLDKPFLYFVRHNPTGIILYMGRFNPRLLP